MRITVGKHTISSGLIAAILGAFCIGALAAYVLTLDIPLTIQEPIEILDHPQTLSLYPGQTVNFNIVVQNHAPLDYVLHLDFSLNDPTYQQSYVTTSNDVYVVHQGVQTLPSWLKVSASAPSLTSPLTVSFLREAAQEGEAVSITSMSFQTGAPGSILVIANNTGTSAVTINQVWVNNVRQTTTNPALPSNINANAGMALNITLPISAGYAYQVKLVSSKGNAFLYTGTAPT
jgi:hypothetical protein